MSSEPVGLSVEEKLVSTGLAFAWNAFVDLPNTSEQDKVEFMQAIHRAQGILAMRVARRINPEVWRTPP